MDVILPDTENRLQTEIALRERAEAEVRRLRAELERNEAERRRSDEALARSERKARRLVDSNIIGVICADFAGNVTEANEAFTRLVGYSREELVGNPGIWRRITPPEYLAQDERVILDLREYGGVEPFEKEYLRKDGSRVAVLVGVAMLDAAAGVGICFAVDITQRKLIEDQLKNSLKETQDAVRALEDFMSIASHELRTPLTSVGLHIEMANRMHRESGSPLPAMGRMLDVCEQQVQRLTALLDNLLDLTRADSGRLVVVKEEVELSLLAQEVIARQAPAAATAGATLSLSAPPSLSVYADPLRVDQILTNLICNAVKYGERSPVELILEEDASRGVVRIIVRDRGPGIPRDIQGKIFERFGRADSSHHIPGLGLGLYIVRQIAEVHGGSIRLDSEPGEGATFTVELPKGNC